MSSNPGSIAMLLTNATFFQDLSVSIVIVHTLQQTPDMCKTGIFNSKQKLHHNYGINRTHCPISQFIVPSQEECKKN